MGNADVNGIKLQPLPVGERFELIPFTFALPWKEPKQLVGSLFMSHDQRSR